MGWVPIGPNDSANVSVLKVNLNICVFFFVFEKEIDADYYSDFKISSTASIGNRPRVLSVQNTQYENPRNNTVFCSGVSFSLNPKKIAHTIDGLLYFSLSSLFFFTSL
jgi:hypothetical protein